MSISDRLKNSKIGELWLKYEQKIVLAIGIVLIAGASFEVGFLQGRQNPQASVVINKTATSAVAGASTCPEQAEGVNSNYTSAKTASVPATNNALSDMQKCAFAASKNSNKFHLATCQFAQKIKPENKICFASTGEAEKRGYQGAKCCVK